MNDGVLVSVKSMQRQCSLKVRHLDSRLNAMSDCCKKPATHAVVDYDSRGEKVFLYRCIDHRDIVRLGIHVTLIPRWSDST